MTDLGECPCLQQVILEAAGNGSDPEEIMRLVWEDFRRRFGRRLAKGDIDILVGERLVYFKSRKMLA